MKPYYRGRFGHRKGRLFAVLTVMVAGMKLAIEMYPMSLEVL